MLYSRKSPTTRLLEEVEDVARIDL
jgi:hypothetical protein